MSKHVYSNVLVKLQRLIESKLLLRVKQVVDAVIIYFKVGAPDYVHLRQIAQLRLFFDFGEELPQRQYQHAIAFLHHYQAAFLLLLWLVICCLRLLRPERRLI